MTRFQSSLAYGFGVPSIPLPEPPLREGNVLLRPWSLADAPAVTAACQDPEIPRWTIVPFDYTERDAIEFLGGLDADQAAGRQLSLAIVDPDDVLLGAIGMSNFDWPDLKAEIGYWVAREARRRGVGARALRLLSRWAIEELGLERIELPANPRNAASLALARRAGFTREGTLRRYRYRHGVREDLVMHSLLAEDLGR
jgi:RimJ/RimL family protein N-acetyltransferase